MPRDRHAGRGQGLGWGAAAWAVLLLAPRSTGFRAMTLTRGSARGSCAAISTQQQRASRREARARCSRDLWTLKSGETESRGRAEGGGVGSVGSDESNNWGMDDSIDVNAIRLRMMEKAGYTKRGESDGGEEWITVDEDGSDSTVDRMKDTIASTLRTELVAQDSLNAADASALVEEVFQDTDLAKFFDEEFQEFDRERLNVAPDATAAMRLVVWRFVPDETKSLGTLFNQPQKGTSALRELAEELKTDEGAASYADRMSDELAELLQAEEDKAAEEIERRQAPVKAKLDRATAELEEAMAAAEEARREFEGDFTLQLMSFRQKGVLRQAAFVGSVLIANQAVYQAILVADDRSGNPAFALGGLVASAALLWFYGYRPIKL